MTGQSCSPLTIRREIFTSSNESLALFTSLHLTGHTRHVATCLGVNDGPLLLCHEVLVCHVSRCDDGVMMTP